MDEIKDAKVSCDAGVRSWGAKAWREIVDRNLGVRRDGKVVMWPNGDLYRGGLHAIVMSPDEAEELGHALMSSADAARETIEEQEARQ